MLHWEPEQPEPEDQDSFTNILKCKVHACTVKKLVIMNTLTIDH